MTPERWHEVEAIYQAAMDRPPELRDAYLDEFCGGDQDLRAEVESLLKLNSSPVVVDQPAWQAVAGLLANDSVVAAGTQLGPYRIEGALGAGGMGQVYRAWDPRLDRDVAIKVSREEFGERFQREARAVAALNHPNICTLYDVGPNYLVMELIEGPTLAERIKEGPIPLEEALTIVRQVTYALEAAHDRGIVHRDLKPENIKIKPDGAVKVLDFGLAKRRTVEAASYSKPEHSPTLSMAMTTAGVILGTAAYMSPEQARGKPVDKRADIWAFGVVLYEMLTRRAPFAGPTTSDTLAAVLREEPNFDCIPENLRHLLRSCLEKDPAKRLRDIADARLLVQVPPVAKPRRPTWLPWLVAALAVTLGAAGGWMAFQAAARTEIPRRPVVRLDVDLGGDVSLGPSAGANVVISPDSSRLVFVSNGRLFCRRLDQASAVELPGTEGAVAPFFSPDGNWVGFHAGGKLKKISVEGGAATVICDATSMHGASWGDDGNIVAALRNRGPLVRVPATGGPVVPLTEIDPTRKEVTHRSPQVLPGARAVLFTAHTSTRGSFDEATIELISLRDRRRKTLHHGGTFARYVPVSRSSGRILYVSHGTLYALVFDVDRLEVAGTPRALADRVAYSTVVGSAQFDVSRTGTLVYLSGTEAGLSTIQWLDAAGSASPLVPKPDGYAYLALSPDSKRLAFSTVDLWLLDWRRTAMTRLTFNGGAVASPVWTPDGSIVVFSDMPSMLWTWADGGGKPQVLMEGTQNQFVPWSFTRNGNRLAYSKVDREGNYDIWTASIDRTAAGLQVRKVEPFLQTPFHERQAMFSPNGRWIAYSSNDSGRFEIYVRAFPDSGRRVQVSSGGGLDPVWSPNGRGLFFRTESNRIMVAGYRVTGGSFTADTPRLWLNRTLTEGPLLSRRFDVSPDGRRLAAILPVDDPTQPGPHNHVVYIDNLFVAP